MALSLFSKKSLHACLTVNSVPDMRKKLMQDRHIYLAFILVPNP